MINKQKNSESHDAWFSVDLCQLTIEMGHTECSLSFPHIPSKFPLYFPSQSSFHRCFGCDLWLAASHCRWDQRLETNTQLSQLPSSWSPIFNCACRKRIIFEASSLIPDLAETGQKMREGGRMSSVSPAGAGNRVKVIRSSHSSLYIPQHLWYWLSYTREGRCKAVPWARVMKMRMESWLLGRSSESCSPSQATAAPNGLLLF